MDRFTGSIRCPLDDAGRLHLPADLHGVHVGDAFVITRGPELSRVLLYPIDDWERIERRAMTLRPSHTAERHRIRTLIMWADEAEVGADWQIDVPPALAEAAALGPIVTVTGRGDHLTVERADGGA